MSETRRRRLEYLLIVKALAALLQPLLCGVTVSVGRSPGENTGKLQSETGVS